MKIAYITHFFPPTGFAAAVNTFRMFKGLADRGHKLLVFCPSVVSKYAAGFELQNENMFYPFDVYYSLPTPLPLSVVIPHVFNSLKVLRHQYDMLITQFHLFHLASYTCLPLKALKGKPWLIRVHDMIPDSTLSSDVSDKGFVNYFYGIFLKACHGMFIKILERRRTKC